MLFKSGTFSLLTALLLAQSLPALAAPLEPRLLPDINLTNDVIVFDAPAFQVPKTGKIMANFQVLVTQRGLDVGTPLAAAFKGLLGSAGVEIGNAAALFTKRIAPFGAIGISGKTVKLTVDGCNSPVKVGETAGLPDLGLLQKSVEMASCGGANLLNGGLMVAQADPGFGSSRVISSKIFPSGPTGFGVISDIDDTIKISEVLNKPALLKNTFLKEFEFVPGMPEVYAGLKEKLGQPPFFYVSGSPFQLYPALQPFVNAHYPGGPLLMKNLTVSLTSLQNFIDSSATQTFKLSMIARINSFYPKKNFVLIGDSTEKDPETYGEAFRVHGGTFIQCIWIREVKDAQNTDERFAAAFKGVPANKIRRFTDPAVLANVNVPGGEC
jgi:hypothetical protein